MRGSPPYGIVLNVGLAIEIGHGLAGAPERLKEPHRLAAIGALIALNLALLIHQPGELGERIEGRFGPSAKT
jgi:hypothetical protein